MWPCVIILVEHPGCDKSISTTRHFETKGYVRIKKDALHRMHVVLELRERHSRKPRGLSSIIRTKTYNKELLVYSIVMEATSKISNHLNPYRKRLESNPSLFVAAVAYHKFACRVENPSESEGITQIGRAKFVPKFATHDEYNEFMQLS